MARSHANQCFTASLHTAPVSFHYFEAPLLPHHALPRLVAGWVPASAAAAPAEAQSTPAMMKRHKGSDSYKEEALGDNSLTPRSSGPPLYREQDRNSTASIHSKMYVPHHPGFGFALTCWE
jgi:hypothetical protein